MSYPNSQDPKLPADESWLAFAILLLVVLLPAALASLAS